MDTLKGRHKSIRGQLIHVAYALWAAALFSGAVVVVNQRLETSRIHSAATQVPDSMTSVPVLTASGEPENLFAEGVTSAVVFVSSTCDYCRKRARRIEAALARLDVDEARIVLVRGDSADWRYARESFGSESEVRSLPAVALLRGIGVGVVPTFVVVDANQNTLYAGVRPPRSGDLIDTAIH